jgi:sigma-E factor negative regulatory protein RseA
MENMDKREMISALADGQLMGDVLAQAVDIAAKDASARDAWHEYHLIGDVLRADDLARGVPADRFLARLRDRLRDDQIEPSPADTPVLHTPDLRREAANDGSFRWKLVAGAASVAAVSAIAWSLVSAPAGPVGPQLAGAPAGTVLTGSERGVMIRDPRLDGLLEAHRQLGGAALVAPAGYLRNATLDGPVR